jgi:hypothetical protein
MECVDKRFTWKYGTPAVGWWPTKREADKNWSGTYRWFNGECWSYPAFEHESAQKAAYWAEKKDDWPKEIMMWSEWPDGSKRK